MPSELDEPNATPPEPTAHDKLVEQFEFDGEPAPVTEAAPVEETEKPAQDAGGKTAPNQHAPLLLRRAQEAGLSADYVAATPTSQLEDVVYHLEQQERRILRERREPRQEAPQEVEDDTPLVSAKLKETLDPDLVAELESIRRESRETKKAIAGISKSSQQRESTNLTHTLDGLFAKHPDIFGSGPGRMFAPDSEYMLKRHAALAAMERQEGSLDDRFEHAVKILYGVRQKAEETDKALQERRQQFAKGGTAQPTQRNPRGEPKSLQKAKRVYDQQIRELNQENGVDDENAFD